MKTRISVVLAAIRRKAAYIAMDTNLIYELYDYTKDKYNLPKSLTFDILFNRETNGDIGRFELFAILDGICQVDDNTDENYICDFFTDE